MLPANKLAGAELDNIVWKFTGIEPTNIGTLIENKKVSVYWVGKDWHASVTNIHEPGKGPTLELAVLRALAAVYQDEIYNGWEDIPF